MTPKTALSMTGKAHRELQDHLFPGDNLEAAAILLCVKCPGPRVRFVVKDVLKVPHDACALRDQDALIWPGIWLENAIDQGEPENLTLILIHSHPGGFFGFSDTDSQSDAEVIPSLFHAYGTSHGSAIMTPNGAIMARLYVANMTVQTIELVSIYGDDILFYWSDSSSDQSGRPLAFTSNMTSELGRLTAAVIGVSGTGSIVSEQLARLGFGSLTLVDFDHIEPKNLNRILNSTLQDANTRRFKVDLFAEAIASYRGQGVVIPVAQTIASRDAVLACSQADVIFCCVDTLEARHIADLMASAFVLPLFDVGVVIPLRQSGEAFALADVCGRVDYVQPEGASLSERGIYSPESLRAEYIRTRSPEAYKLELEAGYIKGLAEEAPAVITLNMRAAATCVSEFIARAFPFRQEANGNYARTLFSLAACEEDYVCETAFPHSRNWLFARGGSEPLLGMPALGQQNIGKVA